MQIAGSLFTLRHSAQVDDLQVLALGTVGVTALGCLMLLDHNNAASSAGSSAVATLLLILNVAFLVLVAFLILRQSKRRIGSCLRQTQVIGQAAFCQGKTVCQLLKSPFAENGQRPCLQVIRPSADVAMSVRPPRDGSMQPMLSGPNSSSGPVSSLSSFSHDGC